MDYVSQPDYDTKARPGICAGVSYEYKKDGPEHHFKFHFDDQEAEDEFNIPSQKKPAADEYISQI